VIAAKNIRHTGWGHGGDRTALAVSPRYAQRVAEQWPNREASQRSSQYESKLGGNMKKLVIAFALMVSLVLIASTAFAQQTGVTAGSGETVSEQDIQLLRSDVRSEKKQIIAANMQFYCRAGREILAGLRRLYRGDHEIERLSLRFDKGLREELRHDDGCAG
jgi:hypothetical protein